MAKDGSRGLTRRDLLKAAGAGAIAAAAGSAGRARAQPKTLKIVQWSHFIPAYDKWFDGVFCKRWGEKNGTQVIVDHIAIGEINARAAAEVSAQRGHDLFMFLSPPAAYEKQVIDHSEIYQAVEKKWGKVIDLGHKSTFNPKTKKYFAFSDSYVPDPGNYRQDLWSQVGFPKGPDTWEDVRKGGKAIKDKFGNPVGIGLSQELDTNMAMRALMWSFGASEQDAEGRVTINSPQTIESLKFMRALFKEAETSEVFTWDPSSNNRGILAGKLSFVCNAISVTRTAEKENPDMSKKLQIVPAPKGPVRRMAAEHVMDCYAIWKFAENKEGAKQFLADYIDAFGEAFKQSEFYNFPCFPKTVPDLKQQIANDPKGVPPDKYNVLGDVLEWATNVGYPGYASAAVDEAFNTFVIPTMFAKVARDELSPEDSVRAAEKELKRIWDKWKTA
ncbi:ABC transporter substrate-binding protein [Anaeromyxobacter sp. Fw109-5]|uniref:ABC transporter substrate-binding protein n=1 Tax=Anaeromyxobacter sp. (strain Fw109-5) TaxID=404589 RepID=UPI0000ED7631|nr:extracellular solute-binding protein [Anaeromyxobacter sp. Fw109-5]ABS25865.1 extracellular solute-binding protein family 1 [Anaeromyxobacter sp. Fw109-5]